LAATKGIESPKSRHSLGIPIAIGIQIGIQIGIAIVIAFKGIASTEEGREPQLSVDGL